MEATFTARLADYRTLRRDIETNVLAMATSVDGRAFTLQAPVEGLQLRVGGYVALGADRLGQVLALSVVHADAGELGWSGDTTMATRVRIRLVHGEGVVLDGPPDPFHDVDVRPAELGEVRAWLHGSAPARAVLRAGELSLAPGLEHGLDAGGFDRHTFLCGQSGSGKTYALGVLLEQLLLATSLRIVVLDPNSDFVRLPELRTGVVSELARRWEAVAPAIAVHRAENVGSERLRVRLGDLEPRTQAAALQLDAIRDRDEYAELTVLLSDLRPNALDELASSGRPGAPELARRAGNLGVTQWGVWARSDVGSSLDALEDPAVRCLVIDLGSLATHDEHALVADAVLERLWRLRARREPVLIVIDEAHNVCPAEPTDPLTTLASETAVRIAAEGRKFGLYLLASTQRPQKVPANLLSQCDNLVLMRMNSAADLGYLRETFSFVPAGLLDLAGGFRLGQALVAGKLSSHPAIVKMGPRVTEEGGADVPSTWAAGDGRH